MASSSENRNPTSKGNPGVEQNPVGGAFDVSVSIPDKLEIKMVNASALADYEIWIFIASLLSNAVVGFWVAFSTNKDSAINSILFWNSFVFSALFLSSLIYSIFKRSQLTSKSKDIKLKTSPAGIQDHDPNNQSNSC